MSKGQFLGAVWALLVGLGACGETKSSEPSSPAAEADAGDDTGVGGATNVAGSGSGGRVGSSGGTSSAGAGGATVPPPVPPGGSSCVPGIAPSSQFPRLLNRQYETVVRDLLGVTLVGDHRPSELLYSDYDGALNIDAWRLYQEAAEAIAKEVFGGPNRANFIACEPETAGCLTDTIRSFGRKAFRRPLTEAEVQRFEELANTDPPGTPEEVAQTTLVAFLVSPSFLQLTEVGAETEGGAIRLTPYEVAARLSFLLWDSVPDKALDDAADNGELSNKEQILAQAKRMIAIRERSAGVVVAAHHAYFGMDGGSHWWGSGHDTARFPLFSEAVTSAFKTEIDLFLEAVAFDGGVFEDLFLSTTGFVNQDTAPIYGLSAADYGSDLVPVDFDPEQRPGFLTRGGFLSSFSRFDATSPTLRGSFIVTNILGLNPGPPSPGEVQTTLPVGDFATQREYFEALADNPSCEGCHAVYLDPPGFVLEAYDAIGQWQTRDARGGMIDTRATVTFGPGQTETIDTPLQLMERLGKNPAAHQVYAQDWVAFATRRMPNPNDACDVEALTAKLLTDDYTILDLMADLTQTDSFRLRKQQD